MSDWLAPFNDTLRQCRLCPRLVAWRERVAREKKREFCDWDYWGRPVPSFGDPAARLLIVGLAPAAHGANRTGRMFTGDSSGHWLYRALYKAGFASQPQATARTDGLQLRDAYITAVIHCAPPANKPQPDEIRNCRRYLVEELQRLERVRVVVALGRIALEGYCRAQGIQPIPSFGHGTMHRLGRIQLLASYHPSRQNTNTGKLTEPMFEAIWSQARALLAQAEP